MIKETFLQGSDEWKAARVGIPTASNFDLIVTTKGVLSSQRQKYLYTLAGERIIGQKEETYQNAAMKRGIEMEAEARSLYELINGIEVEQVGICYQEERKLWAASPDGLVGESGIIEIKCPMLPTMVSYHLEATKLELEYWQQLQGQLLVTGRHWVDIMAYYPGMNPIIRRIERNEKFLQTLENELHIFCIELVQIENKLRGA